MFCGSSNAGQVLTTPRISCMRLSWSHDGVWTTFRSSPTKPGPGCLQPRNCLLNNQREQVRHGTLAVRVAAQTPTFTDAESDLTHQRIDLAAAWQRLRLEDQEVLALAIWEDLPSSQAGQILGISSAAYRIRLHRARKTLCRELDSSPFPAPLADPLMTE